MPIHGDGAVSNKEHPFSALLVSDWRFGSAPARSLTVSPKRGGWEGVVAFLGGRSSGVSLRPQLLARAGHEASALVAGRRAGHPVSPGGTFRLYTRRLCTHRFDTHRFGVAGCFRRVRPAGREQGGETEGIFLPRRPRKGF